MIGLAVEMLVIGSVPIGPRFLPTVVLTGVAASIAAVVFAAIAARRTEALLAREREKNEENRPIGSGWTWKHTLAVVASIACVAAILLMNIADREIKDWRNARESDQAWQTFTVTTYPAEGERFDREALNQTLAEMEGNYRELKDEWELLGNQSIYVHLFADVDAYRNHSGNTMIDGHVSCTENGPVISIPLENAPSTLTNDNRTRLPAHEVAHALVCLSTGREAFYSIPRWFHEGTAQRYEIQGISRIMMRAVGRLTTWLEKDQLLEPERFCATWFMPEDGQEQAMLYRASLEFTKFLDSKYGEENVNLIVDDVRRGASFNDSMQRRFGGECNDLYGRWIGSF